MIDRIGLRALAELGIAAGPQTGSGIAVSRSSDSLSPFYSPGLVSYGAQDGRFPLIIREIPFGGVPQVQLEQTLYRNLWTPAWAL